MGFPLELLPQELLDEITNYLDSADVARLGECSQQLSRRLQRSLYNTPEVRNNTLRNACTLGLPCVARLVILAGASPTTVTGDTCIPTSAGVTNTTTRTLTLHLAAKHGHARVFNLLLRLGARLDQPFAEPPYLYEQGSCFVGALCTRPQSDFVIPFLAAGLGEHLSLQMKQELLLGLIKSGTRLAVVQQLLNVGADPNYPITQLDHVPESPLAAAAAQGLPDFFQVLLDRGGQINGASLQLPVKKPLHIPLFAVAHAAAAQAAKKTCLEELQTCLDAGADIDYRVRVLVRQPRSCCENQHERAQATTSFQMRAANFTRPHGYQDCHFYFTTPLLSYLDSIPSWEPDEIPRHKAHIFWFLQHGASLDLSQQQFPDNPGGEQLGQDLFYIVKPPSPLELLIHNWGLQPLLIATTAPGFLAVVKLLVTTSNNAPPPENLATLLSQCDCDDPVPAELSSSWRAFLACLVKWPGLDLGHVFREVVVIKGSASWLTLCIGELAFVTLEVLLEAGADINWCGGGGEGEGGGTMSTALMALCEEYHNLESRRRKCNEHAVVHRWNGGKVAAQRARLFEFLLERGADPGVRWKGKTAVQMLEMRSWWYGPVGREFVRRLADMIRARGGEGQSRGWAAWYQVQKQGNWEAIAQREEMPASSARTRIRSYLSRAGRGLRAQFQRQG